MSGDDDDQYKVLTFATIREDVLASAEEDGMEGVVWHHPDGHMAKIKARDFRPSGETS